MHKSPPLVGLFECPKIPRPNALQSLLTTIIDLSAISVSSIEFNTLLFSNQWKYKSTNFIEVRREYTAPVLVVDISFCISSNN